MKRLAQVDNLLIATLWQKQLGLAGLRCEIRNRYLSGAVGELPCDQVAPELWVVNEEEFEQARALLSELQQPAALPAWWCMQCGEPSEGQFGQCWNCSAVRPGL
jgi:rubrerythrin